jgi:hypothetical protein
VAETGWCAGKRLSFGDLQRFTPSGTGSAKKPDDVEQNQTTRNSKDSDERNRT